MLFGLVGDFTPVNFCEKYDVRNVMLFGSVGVAKILKPFYLKRP